MKDDSEKPARWELIFHEDGTYGWGWRRVSADGSIEHASDPHADFGKALADAINHGFRPKEEHWVLKSESWTTSFPPGGTPISTGPDGRVVRRRDRNAQGKPVSPTAESQNLPLERYLLDLAEASAPRVQVSVKVDLSRLLLEIRRKARILPPAGIDPVAAIMHHIAASPHTPKIRALVRIAAAITRESGELDENEIWALSQEALGLLDALIESKIS